MATASERYRRHGVWETLKLKRDSLTAARFSSTSLEQQRIDVAEWLAEAEKTRTTRLPALYLSVLDDLSNALNQLTVAENEFQHFISYGASQQLLDALRSLPLPAPKDLKDSYVELLDKEIKTRTERLDLLEQRVAETEKSLTDRQATLVDLETKAAAIAAEIQKEREALKSVSDTATEQIESEWSVSLAEWTKKRAEFDDEQNAIILTHAATLAATARAGEALAEHAAGSLSAADWNGRAKRERRAAQWMRFGAAASFIFAGAVGWFIVNEAVKNNFDLTVGDGLLRASVAAVIGAFGALLLRESGRHFREADTAEDVALSLKALAPFYANSGDDIRLAARVQVGNAVLVKNVLSRFAHRDAAKHSGEVSSAELPQLVDDATQALGKVGQMDRA